VTGSQTAPNTAPVISPMRPNPLRRHADLVPVRKSGGLGVASSNLAAPTKNHLTHQMVYSLCGEIATWGKSPNKTLKPPQTTQKPPQKPPQELGLRNGRRTPMKRRAREPNMLTIGGAIEP